jgi:hypothetical protein
MEPSVILLAGLLGGAGAIIGQVIAYLLCRYGLVHNRARVQQIALGITAGLVAGAIQYRSLHDQMSVLISVKTKFELVMSSEAARLVNNDKFKARTKGMSGADVRTLSATLTARGMQYVEPADIETWARIKLHLAELSQPICQGMVAKNIDNGSVLKALSKLPEAEMREWARLSIDAGIRALDAAEPVTVG